MKKWIMAGLVTCLLAGCSSGTTPAAPAPDVTENKEVSATCSLSADNYKTTVIVSAPGEDKNIDKVVLKVEVEVDETTKAFMQTLDQDELITTMTSILDMDGIKNEDIQLDWEDKSMVVTIGMDAQKLEQVFHLGEDGKFSDIITGLKAENFVCD